MYRITLQAIGHVRILGIGLGLPCNGGSCREYGIITLSCTLVPVQYREYETGPLNYHNYGVIFTVIIVMVIVFFLGGMT